MRRKYRERITRQIDGMKAIHELGIRLDAYAGITVPTLLLFGERSPAHAQERIDALVAVMPNAEKRILRGQAHTANKRAPNELADLIGTFFDGLLKGDPN
jgi:pimeloyl-ACP methyl ester carboxylesterase